MIREFREAVERTRDERKTEKMKQHHGGCTFEGHFVHSLIN